MKRVVVVASFPGDARYFLCDDLGVPESQAIIATPMRHHLLEGLNGNAVSALYDIRRPGGSGLGNDRLDHNIDRLTTLYPDVQYLVRP